MSVEDAKYKEISKCLLELTNEDNVVYWPVFVVAFKKIIVNDYHGNYNEKQFRNIWLKRVKAVAKDLKIKLNARNDNWFIIKRLIEDKGGWEPSTSSSSSLYNDVESRRSSDSQSSSSSISKLGYRLTLAEKEKIKKMYCDLNCKWQLSSGRYVENIMKEFTSRFEYEHPACSLILDVDDVNWLDVFSSEELSEIRTLTKPTKSIQFPDSMKSFLEKIPKSTNIKDIFLYLNNQIVDPYESRDVYWLKMTLQQTADLFVTGYLPPTNQQERDIIRRVWGFMDTAYDVSELTMRSEKTSYSCQLSNNKKRKLAAINLMPRQAAGEIPDMLIFNNRYEFGVAEVSKTETDNTKEKNDASLKLPKIMKSMLVNLVTSAPSERHNLKVVGMFFSGMAKYILWMKVCFFELSNPIGQVCVYQKTNELYFPVHFKEFMKRMVPLVEQVWINKLEMESRLENVLVAEPLPSSEAEASLMPCFTKTK